MTAAAIPQGLARVHVRQGAPVKADRREAPRQTSVLVQLALGLELREVVSDWSALLRRAERERVTALCWLRSARAIRAHGGGAVTEAWRRAAMLHARASAIYGEALASAVVALERAQIVPIVVKGAPLAAWLYGDPFVRPTSDIDVFVAREDRGVVAPVLEREGWTRIAGERPAEETFARPVGGVRVLLEVHSSLVDDPLLPGLELPVESERRTVMGAALSAHAGALLPGYLATHLIKHRDIPLLWLLDFYTLWSALDVSERADAMEASRRHGIAGYVAWAVAQAAAIDAIRSRATDGRALATLGSALSSASERGRFSRLVSRSDSFPAAARIVAARLWPGHWRTAQGSTTSRLGRRLSGWLFRRVNTWRGRSGVSAAAKTAIPQLDGARVLAAIAASPVDGSVGVRVESATLDPVVPMHAIALVRPRPSPKASVVDTRAAVWKSFPMVVEQIGTSGVAMRWVGVGARQQMFPMDRVSDPESIVGVCAEVEVDGVVERISERPSDLVSMLRYICQRRRAAARAEHVE